MIVWFVTIAALGIVLDRARAGGARRVRSAPRGHVLRRQRLHRLCRARRGLPGRHRRRSALCRHGPLRQQPIRLAWFALVLPALVLNYLGPGRAAAAQSRRRASVLRAGAVLGAVAAGRARHGGGDHRVAGADLRIVLDHPAGDSAWPGAAPRRRAHLGARDGADLRAAGELGADGRDRGSSSSASARRARWRRPTASPSR